MLGKRLFFIISDILILSNFSYLFDVTKAPYYFSLQIELWSSQLKRNGINFLFYFWIVLLSTTSSPLCSNIKHYPARSEISPKFWLDVNYYNGSEKHTQIEIYYSVPSSELTFTHTAKNNIASVYISFIVTNSNNEIILNKSKRQKLRVNSTEATKNKRNGLIDQMVIDLLPGDYKLEVIVKDENSNSESKIFSLLTVPTFYNNLNISTIQFASLISSEKKHKYFLKGNQSVIPNPSRKFNYRESLLYIYYEIYNLAISDISKKSSFEFNLLINNKNSDTLIYTPMQTIVLAGNSCIQTKTLDIRDLDPGNYWLTVSITDIETGVSTIKKNNFTIHNPLAIAESLPMSKDDIEKYRDQIKYFATGTQLELYDKINNEGKMNFLINFWRSKDTSPETPENEYMLNCFARIDYAEKNFKDGLNSDMGRVFIIYGQPDEIENRTMNMNLKPFIIWEYFSTGTGKQQFIFVDVTGNHIYRLVHSTVLNEINNPNWMQEEIQQ